MSKSPEKARVLPLQTEEGPAATKEAAVARFKSTLEDVASTGFITKTVATMPARMKDVIDAKGGPTRW